MKNFENELNHSEQYFHVLTLITLPKNADVIIFWQTNNHKIKIIAQRLIVPSFNSLW